MGGEAGDCGAVAERERRGVTQPETFTCDDCGQTVLVQQVTAYEFAAPCRCRRWISWAHKSPPPAFKVLRQAELF
jgi:uncharacterized paraquat-inducible protein A